MRFVFDGAEPVRESLAMKRAPFLIFILLGPSLASSQMPDASRHRKNLVTEGKGRRNDEIRGQCIVEAGGGNLIAVPCTEVVLILTGTGEDKDPISTRTDHDGNFEFSTASGQSYRVSSGSKFYEVVQPSKPVHSGEKIQIVLKQK